MALSATLEFGNNEIQRYSKRYLVADCHFVFERPHNDFRPESYARCERIEMVVVAPGKDDLTLFQWYYNLEGQEGRLTISMSENGQDAGDDVQVLYFEDAKCISLSEDYDIDSSKRRQIKLGVVAEKMTLDDIDFQRE